MGQGYNQTVAATGGTGARTFSISAGSLGPLSLNSATGAITGTHPGPPTILNFTVMVVDSGTPQQSDTQTLTLDINNPLMITTTSLPDATIGVAYNQTVVAAGGTPGTLTFSISSGGLPAGLTMNAAGMISGTPSAGAINQTFTVRVAEGSSPPQTPVTQQLTIRVVLEVTTRSLPSGTVGVAYNRTVAARGGLPPYTWAVTPGMLPTGLGPIDMSTGAITGTPNMQETAAFTVQVTDTDGQVDTQGFSITIIAAPPMGRNDTPATATSRGNGTHSASISPSGDPNTTLAPDEDFYAITTTMASTVTIDIDAQVNGSPLDSVIEIVDANGMRLNLCDSPAFSSPCVNDDEVLGVNLDSILQIQLGGATTFFVHVNDFRGDARPDLLYQIVITGAN